jgi:hypothetical protein
MTGGVGVFAAPPDEGGGVVPVEGDEGVPVAGGFDAVVVVPPPEDPEGSKEEVEKTPPPQPERARVTHTYIPPRDLFKFIKTPWLTRPIVQGDSRESATRFAS